MLRFDGMSSFWTDSRGYLSVSVNENQPGPVVGYLIPTEGGWMIEGDQPQTVYANRDDGAFILVERYHLR
jgi:hypothetical protein